MVFSSTVFLFLFLPIVLLLYYSAGKSLKNGILLAASLFFYAWGEPVMVLLMLVSIVINYILGLQVASSPFRSRRSKCYLGLAIFINLGFLAFFKYANFLVDNLNLLFKGLHIAQINMDTIELPIGISFFTFQIMSYVIDVYRQDAKVQKSILNLGLYISMFPQLIAGPIVRYSDVARQIDDRQISIPGVAYGVRRFIVGLGKKVLIANLLGEVADKIFALTENQLGAATAWLGILCYGLQIYYDFSGYSDMAIGLGKLFGFDFLENFNYPYISRNIKEFWRRWHISLSTWFRDYLYIPLGGNRKGKSRTYMNLIIVFFLCGLWHGASWNFVVWGLFHGFFLVIERMKFGKVIDSLVRPLQHVYTLVVVLIGWVFFRADTLSQSLHYLQSMFSFGSGQTSAVGYLNMQVILALAAGIAGSMPFLKSLQKRISSVKSSAVKAAAGAFREVALVVILLLCIMYLASSTYNPFIYFRF